MTLLVQKKLMSSYEINTSGSGYEEYFFYFVGISFKRSLRSLIT